jgi:AraC-like DNA-binding protein
MESVPTELLVHLRRAKDRADRSFAEPLDLDRLSAEAAVSKYHFVRTFAATYGETPMRYLARRRMERARDLLRATNLTVTEVCFLVGYSSLGTFSARFRELVGMSPTEYQRSEEARSSDHIPGCYIFMLGPFGGSAISEKLSSDDPS